MDRFTARAATTSDYDAYCRLLPELRTRDPAPTLEKWPEIARETLVLEAEGAVVAVGWARNLGSWAHVCVVIVDPAWQGRGVGRRLMDELARHLRASGCTHWSLSVKRDNVPALRLYESVGLGAPVETTALKIPWSIVPDLPSAAAGAPESAPVHPDEDRALEARFELVPGSVTAARGRGSLPIRLGSPASALALFDPAFPGAGCFRVAAPSLARPLLEAIRPHAPPDVPHVMAVVEDPGVAEVMVAGGAEVRMELFRLAGPIRSDRK